MARSVEDCALLVSAVSARAEPDFATHRTQPPRIGFCRTSRWESASPATHAALESAAERLARAGARVGDFELPADFDAL